MVIILSILVLGSLVASYFYLTRNYNYWRDRNIPHTKGTLPGFGHTLPLLLIRTTLVDLIKQICDDYPSKSMVGFYHNTTPALVIREPELIKTVLQTNFANFSKNMWKIDPHMDSLQKLNPFFSYGDDWLISRKHIGLATTNKNLKTFFNAIEQVCVKLEDLLNDDLKNNNNMIELELNGLASKFTTAVASFASLSVEKVELAEVSHSITLTNIAEMVLGNSFVNLVNQTLNFYFYDLKKFFRVALIPEKVDNFFSGIVKEITHIRKQEKSARNFDFLQLMLNLKEANVIEDNIIPGHVFTFFFNISETSSIALGFAIYQLARHLHIQQKLRDEVKNVLAKHDNQLTYEALKEMTYMDQVLKESQRIYPSVPILGKVCTEEFELKGTDGLSCRVHPETEIFLNVLEMHRNPKYWPNPDVFDPDRFASDRKSEIDRFTYLPFGEGPRICVAKRFALLQSKAYLATILNNYSVEPSPKTPKEPFKFLPGKFLTTPIGGLWARFKPL